MTLPIHPIAVLCDVDVAWELKEELREAGVLCLYKEEQRFKAAYKGTNDIGLVWCMAEFIISLPNHNAATKVSMPEFRAAFGLNPKPQP